MCIVAGRSQRSADNPQASHSGESLSHSEREKGRRPETGYTRYMRKIYGKYEKEKRERTRDCGYMEGYPFPYPHPDIPGDIWEIYGI